MHSENKTLVKKCDWSMIRHASAGLFDGINKAEDETHMSPRDIFDRQFKFADEYMRLAYLYPLVKGSQGSFIYSRYYIVIWGRIRI